MDQKEKVTVTVVGQAGNKQVELAKVCETIAGLYSDGLKETLRNCSGCSGAVVERLTRAQPTFLVRGNCKIF